MHTLRAVRGYLRDSVTILFQIFEKLLWIPIAFFVRVRVINPPKKLEPAILTPNHETIFDPWIILLSLPWKTFLSGLPYVIIGKTEFLPDSTMNRWYMKLMRRFMYWGNDVIPLAPSRALFRRTLAALRRGRIVLMFPEGHTRATRESLGVRSIIGEMEEGALLFSRRSGVPIWPLALRREGGGWVVRWGLSPIPILSWIEDRDDALKRLRYHILYLYQFSDTETWVKKELYT